MCLDVCSTETEIGPRGGGGGMERAAHWTRMGRYCWYANMQFVSCCGLMLLTVGNESKGVGFGDCVQAIWDGSNHFFFLKDIFYLYVILSCVDVEITTPTDLCHSLYECITNTRIIADISLELQRTVQSFLGFYITVSVPCGIKQAFNYVKISKSYG